MAELLRRAIAGIGSRQTPPDGGAELRRIIQAHAAAGFWLYSGGAEGADTYCELGADPQRTIIIYGNARHRREGKYVDVRQDAKHILLSDGPIATTAERVIATTLDASHWANITRGGAFVKNLMRRNALQVLGPDLQSPVEHVICWAPPDPTDGTVRGGTKAAIRLARRLEIPWFNLAVPEHHHHLQQYIAAGFPPRTPQQLHNTYRRMLEAGIISIEETRARGVDLPADFVLRDSAKTVPQPKPAPASQESLDVFQSQAECLVNACNCRGVMGAGIAREFKSRYPAMFDDYRKACATGNVRIGAMHVYDLWQGKSEGPMPRYIINFPTKDDWRDDAQLSSIQQGLAALAKEIETRNIRSIAIPALGCGLGNLSWDEVRPLIEQTFSKLPSLATELYPPVGWTPSSEHTAPSHKRGVDFAKLSETLRREKADLPELDSQARSWLEQHNLDLPIVAITNTYSGTYAGIVVGKTDYHYALANGLAPVREIFRVRRQHLHGDVQVGDIARLGYQPQGPGAIAQVDVRAYPVNSEVYIPRRGMTPPGEWIGEGRYDLGLDFSPLAAAIDDRDDALDEHKTEYRARLENGSDERIESELDRLTTLACTGPLTLLHGPHDVHGQIVADLVSSRAIQLAPTLTLAYGPKKTVNSAQLCEIRVGNDNLGDQGEYIGRGGRNHYSGSPLANPFAIGQQHNGRVLQRGDAIPLYREYLKDRIRQRDPEILSELARLAQIAQEKPLTLVCHCAPAPCHGEIVRGAIKWLVEKQPTLLQQFRNRTITHDRTIESQLSQIQQPERSLRKESTRGLAR